MALLLSLTVVGIEAPAVLAAKPDTQPQRSEVQHILRSARSHVGARFRMGAEGQRIGRSSYFDCSGLVFHVFKEAGLIGRIGGGRFGATHYLRWFQRRGLANRRNPKPGDLIIWGVRGKVHHMGIYIGGNRAISALINPWGVSTHRINGINQRVMAYLHLNINR